MTAQSAVAETEDVSVYQERLAALAALVRGKLIRWVGTNGDGLQREFRGCITALVVLTGIGCRLEIDRITEYFDGAPANDHSYATLQCLTKIRIPEDLAATGVLEIPEINAQVFLVPSAETA